MVRVAWIDSAGLSDGSWRDRSDTTHFEALHCVSVGFLLKRTATTIVLCLSLTSEQAGDIMTIPHVAITDICDLVEQEAPDVEFTPA